MFQGLIILILIYKVTGFNVIQIPVKHFTNEDPLFGQTITQSKHGVFVPSPKTGNLLNCILKIGTKDCVPVFKDERTKGLRLVTSVASLISEEENVLKCNQVYKKKKEFEDLNGICQMKNPDEINMQPAILISEKLKSNRDIHQKDKEKNGKQRKKRDSSQSSDDDDDAGTEIAFVLDGSGSIEAEDFQIAKDFIHNVMVNVWNVCFSCNFAIVQYGSKIRTELSLLDNNNVAQSLEKVKNIKQTYNLTKTASAIHHVLTEIFVPENGSHPNSKKMIIVMSDGEILGDYRSLTDVLGMPQMEKITRFAIGVGDKLLKSPKAIKEMEEIAGSGQFFNVSNYAALNEILSKLERGITGIEGSPGEGFSFELAEAGFSSHLMHDKSVLFGAVGAFDWSGGVILKSGDTLKFLNDSTIKPKFSYLGYTVASAQSAEKSFYISGAPRYNLTGAVFIFDGAEKQVIEGDQVGSYFGSVICTLDIDMKKSTHYLLVGAPHFHQHGEEGKVLMYKLNQMGRFELHMELRGDAGQVFARFGAAIASIGSIDGDQFSDVAVGAPLESDSSGSIYIYNGFKDGLRFSQKISPSEFKMKLVHFGKSVSVIQIEQKKPGLAVGSQGRVTIFNTITALVIKPVMTISPEEINCVQQEDISNKLQIQLSVCFNVIRGILQKDETVRVNYKIDLDSGVKEKRLAPYNDLLDEITLTPDKDCTGSIFIKYLVSDDCFQPMKINLSFSLNPKEPHTRILDAFTPTEIVKEIVLKKECLTPDCAPNITLTDSMISNNIIIIGETQSTSISFNFTNRGDQSYTTTLTLTYPSIFILKKSEGTPCPVKNDNQIQCQLDHPVFKAGAQTNLILTWQLNDNKYTDSNISAVLTSNNNGIQTLDSKVYSFDVKYSLPIQVIGEVSPNIFNIEEGKKLSDWKQIKFTYNFVGENKYGAAINVTVKIKKHTFKTDFQIINVTPQICNLLANNKPEESFHIRCTMTKLEKIIIDAKILIHDVKDSVEKIIAEGEFNFDETRYATKEALQTVSVEVSIRRLVITLSKAAIIGGSIGGFILLFIIIIILIKCGFFRRRHKLQDQNQQRRPVSETHF